MGNRGVCHATLLPAQFIRLEFSPVRVSPAAVLRTLRRAEYFELIVLFFMQGAGLSMFFVPLGAVLDANGLHAIKSYAFATAAVAAFISPLIFGAMADRHAPPAQVLRWLATATGVAMALASLAIKLGWNAWAVLGLIQLHALCASPIVSISATIVFARLADAKKEYGPIRAMITLGWMAGCLVVSLLNGDRTPVSGFAGAVMWWLIAVYTFFLPQLETPKSAQNLTWHERLGLDALTLLKNPDHRVVFLLPALFNIPISAFYPYAPAHLREIGLQHTTAWMSLAQITEVIAMFSIGALLLRWRLKWILALGLGFGVLRFALSAFGGETGLIMGVILHGCSYALVFITAQIYLDQRVAAAWRARAQALMTLLNSGVGNFIGYLSAGWWFSNCTSAAGTRWPRFWGVLSAFVVLIMIYFLAAYRGQTRESETQHTRS